MVMGISSTGLSSAWNYVCRAARIAPDFIVGTGNESFSKVLGDSFRGAVGTDGKRSGGLYFKNFWTQFKNAIKASEDHNKTIRATHGGFWKGMWHEIKTTPKLVGDGWKTGTSAAKALSKNSFWGGLKGTFGALGKRLPLIGGIIMLATEIGNVNGGMKEGGLLGGAKETGKSLARVGTGMLGMAIGTALIPIPVVGSIVGYMAGDALAKLFVGKNYSERKAEADAAKQQTTGAQTTFQGAGSNFDTGTTNPFSSGNASEEEVMKWKQMLDSGYGLGNSNDILGQNISYKN